MRLRIDSSNVTEQTQTATLRDACQRITGTGGAIVIRRLNSREYKNMIRDLFGVDLEIRRLDGLT